MTEFVENASLDEDERFPALAELLEDFLTPQLAQQVDPVDASQAMVMYVEKLALNLPIEVQELRDENNRLTLGTSPPTQWIETTVQPVLHHLSVTLELEEDEAGNKTLES